MKKSITTAIVLINMVLSIPSYAEEGGFLSNLFGRSVGSQVTPPKAFLSQEICASYSMSSCTVEEFAKYSFPKLEKSITWEKLDKDNWVLIVKGRNKVSDKNVNARLELKKMRSLDGTRDLIGLNSFFSDGKQYPKPYIPGLMQGIIKDVHEKVGREDPVNAAKNK